MPKALGVEIDIMDILARDGLSEAALRTLSYRSVLGISGLQTKLGHHGVRKGVRGGHTEHEKVGFVERMWAEGLRPASAHKAWSSPTRASLLMFTRKWSA